MTLTNTLTHVWWGNTVSQWLLALAVTVLKSTRFGFVALIGLWAGSRILVLPEFLDQALERITIVVVVLQVGIWATKALSEWLKIVGDKRSADGETLTWIAGVNWTGKIIIWAIALLIGLENLGIDVTGLVAGLGIGGIAVALAVQNILGDLFSAFSIYIDKPFVLGDLSFLNTDPSEDSTGWHVCFELPERLVVASEVGFHQSARPCSGSSPCSPRSWFGTLRAALRSRSDLVCREHRPETAGGGAQAQAASAAAGRR